MIYQEESSRQSSFERKIRLLSSQRECIFGLTGIKDITETAKNTARENKSVCINNSIRSAFFRQYSIFYQQRFSFAFKLP